MENVSIAFEILQMANQLDIVTIKSLVGVLIDLTAAKSGEDPVEIVGEIRKYVKMVNEEMGRMEI